MWLCAAWAGDGCGSEHFAEAADGTVRPDSRVWRPCPEGGHGKNPAEAGGVFCFDRSQGAATVGSVQQSGVQAADAGGKPTLH